MRVVRTFSFDVEKDRELLEFLDGCRNASDSVRGLLRKALGLQDTQSLSVTISQGASSVETMVVLKPPTQQVQPVQQIQPAKPVQQVQPPNTIQTVQPPKPPLSEAKRLGGLDSVFATLNNRMR